MITLTDLDACQTLEEIAKAEKINESYLCRVLRLTLLSPALTEARLQALQARTADKALTIHVVAHLGGTTGAALLLDMLALLHRHPPAPRCVVQVHVELPDHDSAGLYPAPLAEVQAYAALRELQAAAQSGLFELCFLGAMTDERGLQPFDAAGREHRLADWLFHRMAEATDPLALPAPAPVRAQGAVRAGEFAAFGLAERAADRHAVRAHLSHELMLRLLAQLRYNHWRAGLGFVTHPRVAGHESLAELMNAWGLSDAHFQLAVPLPEIDGDTLPSLSIEQEWQMLETHFVGLISLVTPSRRINELWRKHTAAVGLKMVFEVASWPELLKKSLATRKTGGDATARASAAAACARVTSLRMST